MANTYTTLNDLFTGVANAIRAKKKSIDTIIADTFPSEIESIKTGFDYNNHNIISIPDYAFYNCIDLNNVNCYNLTSVGTSAFEGCANLEAVILYEQVSTIGENAFKGCSNATIYCMFDSKPETWHENWNPDNCAVVWVGGAVETWDISATEEDNVVAKLYKDVYESGKYSLMINGSGNMKDYTMSNSVINTPWYTNYRTDINSIMINDSITTIGGYAFHGCTSLTSITIPNSVTSIGDMAFAQCSSLIYNKYSNGNYLGNELNPYLVFVKTNSTSIYSYEINSSTRIICNNAFNKCSNLNDITIPDSVISIGARAFNNCTALTSITIPDGVTELKYNVFATCTQLASIVIPVSVTNIGMYALRDCSALTSIVYSGTVAQWQEITFGMNWNENAGAYTVHCTDGDIAKDGTITYHSTT